MMEDDDIVLSSVEITKDIALNELTNSALSKEETDEYLEILAAINEDHRVFSIETPEGEYLIYVKK